MAPFRAARESMPSDPRLVLGVVGPGRLELPTLRLSGVRSNHLSYGPIRRPATMDERPVPGVPGARDRAPGLASLDRVQDGREQKERETKTAAFRHFSRSSRD